VGVLKAHNCAQFEGCGAHNCA